MKTDHPTQVIKYGMKVKLIDSNTARETIDRFSAWKTTLKGQKKHRVLERAVEEGTSKVTDVLSKVEELLECRELLVSTCTTLRSFTTLPIMFLHQQANVQSWVSKAVEPNIYILVAYIFVHLTYMYGNWQRPSVAINMTLTETKAFQGKLMVTSRHHKTSGTQGPVVLALAGLRWEAFTFYLNMFGREFPATQEMTRLCWLRLEEPYTTTQIVSNHYATTTSCFVLPSLTMTRKAGAARVVESEATQAEMEKLGTRMSHLPSTSAKYYRVRQRKRTTTDVHAVISSATARGNDNANTTKFSPLWSVFVLYSCSCPRTCTRLQPRYQS